MKWSKVIAFATIGLALGSASVGAKAQTRWQNSPGVQKLYEAAKKEGQVVVWGTAANEVEWLPTAFSKVFPGIDVKYLGDNDVGTKAIAEYRAGRHQIDVFTTSFSSGRSLLERNMYKKVDWSMFGLTPDDVVFDGRAALTHNLAYAVIYNTRIVKPDGLPKSWLDLLDPKYKDKMVASTFLLPRLIGALGLTWPEDKMLQFARDMMQTGILLTRAPPESFIQSGERIYAVANFESQAKMWSRNGLPVDYVLPDPVIAPQFYSAVMDKAPNPNAALLLAGYMATQEGKVAGEAHNFEGDYRKGSPHPIAQKIWSSGATVVFDRIEEMTRRDALIARVNAIISGQAR
jgi:ABC-type Fe3+ transport system substrate-binding protein